MALGGRLGGERHGGAARRRGQAEGREEGEGGDREGKKQRGSMGRSKDHVNHNQEKKQDGGL